MSSKPASTCRTKAHSCAMSHDHTSTHQNRLQKAIELPTAVQKKSHHSTSHPLLGPHAAEAAYPYILLCKQTQTSTLTRTNHSTLRRHCAQSSITQTMHTLHDRRVRNPPATRFTGLLLQCCCNCHSLWLCFPCTVHTSQPHTTNGACVCARRQTLKRTLSEAHRLLVYASPCLGCRASLGLHGRPLQEHMLTAWSIHLLILVPGRHVMSGCWPAGSIVVV